MPKTVLAILFAIGFLATARANPKSDRAKAMLGAADECQRMPPSLNPWGAKCEAEVASRWAGCEKSRKEGVAALHDCLGFKRPPSPTGVAALQLQSGRKWAVNLCASLASVVGEGCKREVGERFERCGPPWIAHEIEEAALMQCLGLPVPPPASPVKTLVSCDKADARVRLSATVAHQTPWPGSKSRLIDGQTFHLAASPVFDQNDIQKLRLEEQDGERRMWIELAGTGAKRLAQATRDNVGQFVVLDFEGKPTAVRVETPISGREIYFYPGDREPSALCRKR
jgi:hypothetical protein